MNASTKTSSVENLGKLVLKVADVRLEDVAMSHINGEEMLVILLGFTAGDVLGEKYLSYLLEIVERMRQQRIKPIRGHTFLTD